MRLREEVPIARRQVIMKEIIGMIYQWRKGAGYKKIRLCFIVDREPSIVYSFNMKTMEISEIDEMLEMLPETARQEVRDFAAYLLDRERRRKELVERVLKAEQNPDIVECKTPEEFIQAIINAPDDDEG